MGSTRLGRLRPILFNTNSTQSLIRVSGRWRNIETILVVSHFLHLRPRNSRQLLSRHHDILLHFGLGRPFRSSLGHLWLFILVVSIVYVFNTLLILLLVIIVRKLLIDVLVLPLVISVVVLSIVFVIRDRVLLLARHLNYKFKF